MNVLRWCTAFVMFIRLCLVFCYDLLDKLYNRIWISLLIKIATALNVGIDALICDSLPPVKDLYIRKDFETLLSDCTTKELNLLFRVLEVTKKALRE